MFDLGKIAETISGLFSGGLAREEVESHGVLERLHDAGLHPGVFEGLTQDEILQRLQDHGLDPAQLGGGQIAELLSGPDASERINSLASSWADHGRPPSDS